MGLKENIKSKRLELGMTLDEVAEKLGVKKPTLHRYESGVISNIPSDKIEDLAKIFDVSPSQLMGWNDDKYKDFNLDEKEREFIDLYESLDSDSKKLIIETMKKIVKK